MTFFFIILVGLVILYIIYDINKRFKITDEEVKEMIEILDRETPVERKRRMKREVGTLNRSDLMDLE